MADGEENTPTTRDISFTINDGTDPIEGASVKIGSETKTTGSAGGCTFTGVEEGTVSVEVSKEGYTTKTESITVDSEHTAFTISLVATAQEETGGSNETGGETSEEETAKDEFPSFRKAYKYRGGFDKFVYDQLKKANSSEDEEE